MTPARVSALVSLRRSRGQGGMTAKRIPLAVAAAALSLTGCGAAAAQNSQASQPVPASVCDALSSSPGSSSARTTVLLTDHRTPDLTAAARLIAADPGGFANRNLGGPAGAGPVEVMTYDAAGEVSAVATYDLAGKGNGARRGYNARLAGRCLQQAVDSLPAMGPGGNVFSAIGRAAAQSVSGISIVVFGMSRASDENFAVATTPLDTAADRSQVLDQLSQHQLVPDLSGEKASVVIVDPAEGVQSGIAQAGIEAFAGELCSRLQAGHCSSELSLR